MLIKSMTGYGRGRAALDGMNITVEVKSVNSRFLEFNPRIGRGYSFLEDKLKTYAGEHISRGKVDCIVQIDAYDTPDCTVEVNRALAAGYADAARRLSEILGIPDNFTIADLMHKDGIFIIRQAPADEEKVWNDVRLVFDEALASFDSMRIAEGSRLREDVLSRADAIIEKVVFIESRSPQTVREYNEKLRARISELLAGADVDEQRLLTEAAVYADKVAVAEETVRLRSHIDQLHTLLDSDAPVGRKLDFLVQEMNREANTIGSKAGDIEINRAVIDIKAEVEKIREQIQNIE